MQLIVENFEEYHGNFQPWSVIYVKVNDYSFPEEQWWDNSLSILEMWAYELSSFICGDTTQCNLFFMDGNYSIQLTSNESCKVRGTFWGPKDEVLLSDSIDVLFFAKQILFEIEKIQTQRLEIPNSKIHQRLSAAADEIRKSIEFSMSIQKIHSNQNKT